jgi:hypothetical protein
MPAYMGQNLQTVLYAELDVHAEQHELMLPDAGNTKMMLQLHHFQVADWHFLSHLKDITYIQNVQKIPCGHVKTGYSVERMSQ